MNKELLCLFDKAMEYKTKEDALAFLWINLTEGKISDGDIQWAKEVLSRDINKNAPA